MTVAQRLRPPAEDTPSQETETSPEVVFFSTSENFPLENQTEIPYEYWRPIFGGEALEHELWDKILQEEGEFVIIKGSGVIAMIMGGYEVDPSTGLAIAEKRADIDIDIPQHLTEVLERAKKMAYAEGNVAHKAEVAGVQIDFVDEKKVREQLYSNYLDTENSIVLEIERVMEDHYSNLANQAPETKEQQKQRNDYFQGRLNALARTYMHVRSAREYTFGIEEPMFPLEELPTILEDMYQNDGMMQMMRRYMPYADSLEDTSNTYLTTLTANAFSKMESVAVKLERKNGELVATLQDPLWTLKEEGLFVPSIERQRALYQELGIQPQINSRNQIDVSGYFQTISAARMVESLRYHEMAGAFYPASALGRLIRSSCEMGVDVFADPMVNMAFQNYYEDVFAFAQRLANEENVLRIVNDEGDIDTEKEATLKEIIQERLQKEFARAAFSNPTQAVCYMLAYLPLGNFVSKDLAHTFDEYHKKYKPNNTMIDHLMEGIGFEGMMMPGYEHPKSREDLTEGMEFIKRAILLGFALYPQSSVESIPPEDRESPKTARKTKYTYMENPPKSASEALAFACTCANWTPDTHEEQIKAMVEGWKPKGDFNTHWGINQETTFTYEVTYETVAAEMLRMKPILDAIEEQEEQRMLEQSKSPTANSL